MAKKIGRPPVEHPLRKRWFRCTDEQWDKILAAGGGNRSQWIRAVLERAAAKKLSR